MTNTAIAMESAPIYILLRDDYHLRIMEASYSPNSDDCELRKSFPSNLELFQRWRNVAVANKGFCEFKKSCFEFYTTYLIIAAGEKEQRTFHSRITANNTRNIKYHVEKVRKYLKESIESALRQEVYNDYPKRKWDQKEIDKEVKERLTMLLPTAKNIDELITRAIQSTKDEMGFPATDPVEYSYKVTDTVVVAATSESCREYLESLKSRVAIFPDELKAIKQELERKYNDEAEFVIAKIKETKSREHIAAFSITSEKDQTLISIVNMQRQHIRMEAWKFLAMVQRAGESLRLTELSKPRMGEPPPFFIFNSNKEGVVVGKFNLQKSVIEVVCLHEGTTSVKDKAAFVVDSTYTMCIYTTLKRLQEDGERFKRLREEAQTLVATVDPFDLIYHPITT